MRKPKSYVEVWGQIALPINNSCSSVSVTRLQVLNTELRDSLNLNPRHILYVTFTLLLSSLFLWSLHTQKHTHKTQTMAHRHHHPPLSSHSASGLVLRAVPIVAAVERPPRVVTVGRHRHVRRRRHCPSRPRPFRHPPH